MKQPKLLALTVVQQEQDDDFVSNQQINEFLYCISQSFSVKHACSMSGISYDSMLHWLNPNDQRARPNLQKLFQHAKASAYAKHLSHIHNSKDWKAHAFWLERHEQEYQARSMEQGAGSLEQQPNSKTIQLSPDMLKTLSDAYDSMRKEKGK
jgi:hypothetical protein